MPTPLEETVRKHGERIEKLEAGQVEIIRRIGAPPDDSTGEEGSGMARTLAQIATDVRELRQRNDWPARWLKGAGAVLAVLVPLVYAVRWALLHLHYAP